MNTIQAADKWGVDIKVARDRAKIIPLAEKKMGVWSIPDESDMPPISSRKAMVMLNLLSAYNEGGKPNYSRTGIRLNEVEHGYKYLADCGYITGKPGKVTAYGKKLLVKLEKEPTITAKAGVGFAGVEVEK